MRVEYFTLAMQFLILFVIVVSLLNTFRTARMAQRTAALIESYRREIDWLTARLDALEAGRPVRPGAKI